MAVVVPHDLMVWPCLVELETVMSNRATLDAFGIGEPDTRFLPYWAPGPALQCNDPRVKLSAYLRPGKLLLCPSNWSDEPIEALTIRVDTRTLALPAGAKAVDATTGEAAPLRNGALTLSLPARRVRLVVVK